jgi:TRAP-type transport system small permease protein
MKLFYDSFESGLKQILLYLVAAIVVVTMLQIVARFVLEISVPWTEELARYLMIWTSYIGLGVAYRKGQLICVSFARDLLSPKAIKKLILLSDLLCSIFAVVVIIYGIKLCILNGNQVSPSLRWPLSIVYSAIPVGCFLYLLFAFESVVSFFSEERS